jgi:hypothetical protein
MAADTARTAATLARPRTHLSRRLFDAFAVFDVIEVFDVLAAVFIRTSVLLSAGRHVPLCRSRSGVA